MLQSFKPILASTASPVEPAITAEDRERIDAPTEGGRRSLLTRLGTFSAVICSIITFRVVMMGMEGIGEPDIFWHLRNGEYALTHFHLPRFDMYSFTCAGAPWIDHEWLAELCYAIAFKLWHFQGIWLLSRILPALTAVIVFQMARKRTSDPLASGLATLIGASLMAVGSGPRMHHFGWLCFVLMLAILQEFRFHRSAPLWAIPVLFAFWINFHGSWIYGLVVFGIIFACGLWNSDIGRVHASPWSPLERKQLFITGLASAAAVFINPFGYKLVLYPGDMLFRQKLNMAVIQEWLPVTFDKSPGIWTGVAIVLLLAGTALTKVEWRLDDLVLSVFVLYSGLSHARMLLPAGIVLAPIMAQFLTGFSTYDPRKEHKAFNLAIVAVVAASLVFLFPKAAKLQKMTDEKFPSGAARYLREHGGATHLFNDYDWGGYIGWVSPDQKVFVDSRTDIFEYAGVFKDFFEASILKRTGEVMDKYHIDKALLARGHASEEWFNIQPTKWRLTYKDDISVIYERIP